MLTLEPLSFDDFEQLCSMRTVVAITRSLPGDLHTPVGLYARLSQNSRYSFLLESVQGGERVARYSFLGADPDMVVRGRGDSTAIERNGTNPTLEGVRASDFLREHLRGHHLRADASLPPFAGGAVGYLAYEAARWFEPALGLGDPQEADAVFLLCRTVVAFDHAHQRILISSLVFPEEAEGDRQRLRCLYDAAVARADRLVKLIAEPLPPPPLAKRHSANGHFHSNWKRNEFEAAVREIQELILAGECYQAVLSQRFTRPTKAPPLDIYRALRMTNPSPYMFFLNLDGESVIGASPEMLVRCRGRELEYRPIAGTRPRGADEREDGRLAAEMRADEKEVAEHVMLVDLGRNDLGRVAEYGSVEVASLMEVERYSHVQHLVSSLKARLRDGLDRFDALAACFPAGTVTGAPKIRAMQAIRELEPDARGVYAGAVLYADYAGNLDSCIAIRTLLLRDGCAQVQAGAGVVVDSVPEREYEETVSKARALFRAVELAEGGL